MRKKWNGTERKCQNSGYSVFGSVVWRLLSNLSETSRSRSALFLSYGCQVRYFAFESKEAHSSRKKNDKQEWRLIVDRYSKYPNEFACVCRES